MRPPGRGGWRARLPALLLAAWLASPGAVRAHAALVAAVPEDGASLAEAPAEVTLRFDEAVTPLSLRIVGPDGAALALPALPGPGPVLSARLPPGLGQGIYLLGWRVVSADGHPIAGALAFGVGVAAAPATAPAEDGRATAWARVLQGLRLVFYAALVAGPGAALFRLLIAEPPRHVVRGMGWAGLLGLGAALLSLGAQGGLLAGVGWDDLLDPAVWRAGLAVSPAASLGLAAAGFGLVAAVAWMRHPAARWAGAGGALLVALGLPLAGHAATAEPRWLAAAALAVHGLVAAFWIGSLWPLRALLAGQGAACAPVVERFSRLALPGVAALLLAGVVLGALRLGSLGEVVGSDYGQLVLAKAVGFLLLLALAGLNRQRLSPALTMREDGARRLSRSILAEMVVAAAVLGLTAALGRTPPPHAAMPMHHAAAEDVAVATEGGGLAALVELLPGRAGSNRLVVTLGRASGEALPPLEIWAELERAEAGIGPFRRRLRPEGAGRFVHEGPEFALPGRWSVRVEVLVSDFEQVVLAVGLDLPPDAGR
ncbi:CopD family protein [Belnapia sp. F-4-1]|uniref:copper resistance CopC/CopD family protein n=1 Tax=Belnapia sp. F-4-1 TaxID=1545443 RepID=UPI0005B79F48|nr:CopD family protein [Belnapia sp. F-4-1]